MGKGKLIVISGPSGSGKTTICEKLVQSMPEIERSISFTTRAARRGEKDGRDYFFVSKEEFQKRIKENVFLEYAQVFDNYYGTSKNWVLDKIELGKDVILSIDVQGAAQIKKNLSKAMFIFLLPPSMKVLEDRLKKRATDGAEEIEKRLKIAKEEMAEVGNYDYTIINDKVDDAVEKIKTLISK
jgi:guanylate kinase